MASDGNRVLIQRFFDMAEEIDLVAAEAQLGQWARRPRFAAAARHIQLPHPPIQLNFEPRPLPPTGLEVVETSARLYDTGGLAVTFAVALPTPLTSASAVALSATIAEACSSITQAAAPLAREVSGRVERACRATQPTHLCEDYTVFVLRQLPGHPSGQQLPAQLDIPRLLLAETGPIAQAERSERMRRSFSYRPDDLTVVDWNSALVYDPSGALDVVELLELTCVQMLELRAYDARVGMSLDALYHELGRDQHSLFRSSRFTRLSRRIMRRYVDVTEITERIDNGLNLLADNWLARVHRAAIEEFGIIHWQRQLRSKLEVLRQINQLLVDQVTSTKTLGIEAAVVGLILLEVVLAALQMH